LFFWYLCNNNDIMKAAEIKLDFIRQIEGLGSRQLKEAYGVFLNYLNGEVDEFEGYSQELKQSIEEGIKQADAGEVVPLKEVLSELRSKYKLNG
jgi:hypothetical protein